MLLPRLADCHRRFGFSPTPEHVDALECSQRGIRLFHSVRMRRHRRISRSSARAAASSTTRSVTRPAARAPRRLSSFETPETTHSRRGTWRSTSKRGPGRAFVQGDAGRWSRRRGRTPSRHRRHDVCGLERGKIRGLEVTARVDLTGHARVRRTRAEDHQIHGVLHARGCACVLRSRHIACLVAGSSKNAGTGNCCALPPYARREPAEDLARVQQPRGLSVPRPVELHESGAVHVLGHQTPAHRGDRGAPRDPDGQIRLDQLVEQVGGGHGDALQPLDLVGVVAAPAPRARPRRSGPRAAPRAAGVPRRESGCGCRRFRTPAPGSAAATRSSATCSSSRAMASIVRSWT